MALLAGCGGGAAATAPPTAASAPPTASGTGDAPLDSDGSSPPTATAQATWDAGVEQQAAAAGVAAVRAYVRKGLSDAKWAAQLEPLLTDAARTDYLGDDAAKPSTVPDNVPGSTVTGKATVPTGQPAPVKVTVDGAVALVAQGPSPLLAAVTVPTDAGDVLVLLVRDLASDLDNPWLAAKFDLPPDAGK